MFDSEHNGRPVEVTAYLKDDTNGKTLSFRNLKFELISPDYGIEEVQKHYTNPILDEDAATAEFEGPFKSGVWKVRMSYGGNAKDHLAPCETYLNLRKI